jgi:exopolysaccharide biosynthesis polyprenyl glycosylphosphotransferase
MPTVTRTQTDADAPAVRAAADALHPDAGPAYWFCKRVFDILFSATALLLLGVPMLVIAIWVKLDDSDGPVFFRQSRTGLGGRRFNLLKYRTMVSNAEELKEQLRDRSEVPWPDFRMKNDPRVTRIGRFLRKASLDELPQFINVLRGEMSVVGPRPERPVFVERFRQTVPGYMLRHKVRSGITGWAQVNGLRGNTSLERRIEYDIEYIERWSLWLDLKIIAMTVVRVLVDRNAY